MIEYSKGTKVNLEKIRTLVDTQVEGIRYISGLLCSELKDGNPIMILSSNREDLINDGKVFKTYPIKNIEANIDLSLTISTGYSIFRMTKNYE
jgi:hypothetical protein